MREDAMMANPTLTLFAVSSQRVSSQPATFGGWNSICPAMSEIQVQCPSSIPCPVPRRSPAM